MARTPVPTVEDIQRLNEERQRTQAAPVVPKLQHELAVRQLEEKVRALQSQLSLSLPEALTPAKLREGLDEILKRFGVEPVEEVIKILTDRDEAGRYHLTAKDRAHLWMELMQYRMPKLRSMEHSGTVDANLTLVVMKFSTNEVIERKAIPLDTDSETVDVEVTKS